MSVTQYIGARYVPLFADPAEWDSTKAYEPLTIVLYQGASYTSRQAVPVGANINNTDYWVLTGNYNAQVEQYRTEVRTFDGRITANAENIESLNGDLETTNTAIGTLRNDTNTAIGALRDDTNAAISEIDSEIDTLSNTVSADGWVTTPRIANNAVTTGKIEDEAVSAAKLAATINPYSYFNGYNAVFIGDSYTYGTGASDHLDGDTKRFSSILATKLNMTEFNYGVGSTGFCDPGSSGQNAPFKTQVLTAANSMTDEQRRRTHLVVIAGGVNDFNEGATYGAGDMQTGSHDAVSNAINNFPNAIVLLVPMVFKGNGATARLFNFENAIIKGITAYAGTRRARYIRGAWTWNYGLASHYASDKLHPNDLGHMLIATMIYSHIMGGDAYDNALVSMTFESGFNANVDAGGYYQFFNGSMTCQGIRLTHPQLTAGESVKFGSIGNGFAPLQNVAGILMHSNRQKGIWIITNSGNCYVVPSENLEAAECYLSPINYLPSGSY